MDVYEIRYLRPEEKELTRPFWAEVFSEDSDSFLEYYYHAKTEDNQILVKLAGERPVSMVHLNPFRIRAMGRDWKANYIVGVATDSRERHRGHMRDLLCRALLDMYREQMPFTFLMPASEAIYLPFDFTYVYDQEQTALDPGLRFLRAGREDLERIGRFSEEWLSRRFDLYAARDTHYMEMLWDELQSEAGGLEMAFDGEQMVGCQGFWGLSKRENRGVYGLEPYVRKIGAPKPAIMARIVHLPAFLSAIGAEEEMILLLTVEDRILPENNGSFLWYLGKEGSWLDRVSDGEEGNLMAKGSISMTISELTAWLLGYRLPDNVGEAAPLLKKIKRFERIFLDEIV